MISYKLNDWCVVFDPSIDITPYTAPELLTQCLKGKVEGHPSRPDGREIRTSGLTGLKVNGAVQTAAGSLVTLGEVNPEYEALYPGAKERLLESLEEVKS